VTSRERMRVQGEVEYVVPPLPGSDAVILFCRRAQTEPSTEIETLCARLDNLPLAVELAAARAKALSPAQILELLSERLDLFQGARDADPRQATLRATIEWSHDVLSEDERRLFARLAVFAGGCTFDAAVEVCDADLETLQALVEKSLLRFSDERYWMLATIREFAVERLSESGELDGVMELLARYLVDLANEEGAPLFFGRGEAAYARLDLEHANVRAVIEWATATECFHHVATLAVVYREVWTSRINLIEIARWAEYAYRARGSVADELWPHVLVTVAEVRLWTDDRAGARVAMDEALTVLACVDPQPYLEAGCLAELSWILCEDGDVDEARRLAERSLDLRTAHALPTGRALIDLGYVALVAGDLAEAESMIEGARASFRESGHNYNFAYATRMLAEVYRRRREYDAAETMLHEAIDGFGALQDVPTVAACVRDLAILAQERGDTEHAARLWRAGTSLAPHRPGEHVLFPQEIGDLPELEVEAPEEFTIEDVLALVAQAKT
jgi:tetratricopeptide (TPR) repeat protein